MPIIRGLPSIFKNLTSQNVEWQKIETQNVESHNVESNKRSKMTKGQKWQKVENNISRKHKKKLVRYYGTVSS